MTAHRPLVGYFNAEMSQSRTHLSFGSSSTRPQNFGSTCSSAPIQGSGYDGRIIKRLG